MVALKIFHFHPYLGKIPIFTNIFQMGWNHQPAKLGWSWTTRGQILTRKVCIFGHIIASMFFLVDF